MQSMSAEETGSTLLPVHMRCDGLLTIMRLSYLYPAVANLPTLLSYDGSLDVMETGRVKYQTYPILVACPRITCNALTVIPHVGVQYCFVEWRSNPYFASACRGVMFQINAEFEKLKIQGKTYVAKKGPHKGQANTQALTSM